MANDNGKRVYQSDDITIYWDPNKCTHATMCWMTLSQVFKPGEKPWVKIGNAAPEEIIKTIDLCPSGALTYELTTETKVDPRLGTGPGCVKKIK